MLPIKFKRRDMKTEKIKDLVEIVNTGLENHGLMWLVDVHVTKMMNDREKLVDHIVANYEETGLEVNAAKDGYDYVEKIRTKAEPLDKYFSANVFLAGIVQRAEWLKASKEDRVKYLAKPGLSHPSSYGV
tara:strand:- start:489 stop:878 length:390 start_codon:yes stop_codon:yes gene_type:complete